MTAPQGSVRVHQHDQTVTLQIEGQATMQHSPVVRQFADQCLAGGATALSVYMRRMQALEQVAAHSQKSLAQVALNWCTSRPNVIVIPKSNTPARIEENCQASGWRLSPAQVQFLDAVFASG